MFGKKKEEEKQTAEEIKEEVKPNEGDEKAPEAPTEEKVEEKTEEKKVEEETAAPTETDEDETAQAPEPAPEAEVQEVDQEAHIGARIEDLVTKDELTERLAAMDSKLEALVKENTDLKDALSKMREKYEDKDFGGLQKQGFVEPNKLAEDTFESYSRQFMQK